MKILGLIWLCTMLTLYTGKMVAQTISRDVASIGGDSGTHASAGSLQWTIGEGAIETLFSPSSDYALTQGFHQPEQAVNSIFKVEDLPWQITVFPNPSPGEVLFKKELDEELILTVYNMDGTIIQRSEAKNYTGSIQMKDWAYGQYVFDFTDHEGRKSIHLVQKINY